MPDPWSPRGVDVATCWRFSGIPVVPSTTIQASRIAIFTIPIYIYNMFTWNNAHDE